MLTRRPDIVIADKPKHAKPAAKRKARDLPAVVGAPQAKQGKAGKTTPEPVPGQAVKRTTRIVRHYHRPLSRYEALTEDERAARVAGADALWRKATAR